MKTLISYEFLIPVIFEELLIFQTVSIFENMKIFLGSFVSYPRFIMINA